MPTSTSRGTLIGASREIGALRGASAKIGTLSGNRGNMTQEIRKVQTTDSRTLISFYMKQENTSGVLTAVDLTALTSGAVKFEMFNAADGVETIAATATGVTFSADATGLVHYEFDTPMAIAAGYYNGFFLLTVSGKTDHFPVEPGGLRIEINSHTQTAKEAYEAALVA